MCVCVSGQLWVSVSGGTVMVFDASSWSLTNTCHVGNARLVKKTHTVDTPVQPHTKTQRHKDSVHTNRHRRQQTWSISRAKY